MQNENALRLSITLLLLYFCPLGAGILGLPFAFKEAGLVEGCVIMLAVGFISSKAMILLINCKEKILSSPDYYQVWESSLLDHMPQLAL